MGWLDGKVALITGGGSGLGAAIARRFVAEGARVSLFDISRERAEAVRAELGDAAVAFDGDVRRMSDNGRVVAATVESFGHLDVFVGNAGIYDNRMPLEGFDAEQLGPSFDELFGVNVKGYLFGAKAALPELRKTRGSIIFTASISSEHAGYGGVLYIAAKHAIAGMTKQLAFELAPEVRVNAVAPGYVPTNLRGLATLEQGASKRTTGGVAERMPLKFEPTSDDYTGLYVLLASDDNGGVMTGSVLMADGGMSIWGPGR